jgi:hemerythrin-like domain-containing protein
MGLGLAASLPAGGQEKAEATVPGRTATETLMQEHGVIHRLMTVYQECADRLAAGDGIPPGALINAGALADEFVESYHEEMEERYVYPAFIEAGRMAALVTVMIRQHAVGRDLAGRAVFYAGRSDRGKPETREALIATCRSYARMYRAHAAHEDTVLLPALREVIGPGKFRQLGERFGEFARERMGTCPAVAVLERLVEIERMLGIAELDTFTASREPVPR